MRARGYLVVATVSLGSCLTLAAACSQSAPAAIGLAMYAPAGLLDNASEVELAVIEEGENLDCKTSTGEVEGTYDEENVQRFDLDRGGCASGASWCKDITLEQTGNTKVFEIRANAGGMPVARGCVGVVIDQDPQVVEIDVVPILPPACCNDGTTQIGEQCDSGVVAQTGCTGAPTNNAACSAIVDDFVCHCDCLAKEIVLSAPGFAPMLDNGVNTKFDPAFAFAGGNAQGDIPNSFRAVFTDISGPDQNINQRVLGADLQPAPGGLAQQLRLPQDCETTLSAAGPQNNQREPDIARISDDLMAVVFADDRLAPGNPDIRLIAEDPWGCNSTSPPSPSVCAGCTTPPCTGCPPARLNLTSGTGFPAVAGGPPDRALVVWLSGTSIKGRIWVPGADSDCDTCLPAAAEIDFGITGAGRPRVAGNPTTGFVLAYSAANNVYVRTVSPDGSAIGAEIKVNLGGGVNDQPSVAALPDGRFIVVWRNDQRILFQRFDAATVPTIGDQDEALSSNSSGCFDPQVAASGSAGTFWAAAWATADQRVFARFVDAEGKFLRNHVTGGLDDFPVLHPTTVGAAPQFPDVAIGDSGFVAIGWADQGLATAPEGRGIRVRRFPLPLE